VPAVAVGLSITLFLLAAIHLYWMANGVTSGGAVPSRADGTPLFRPGRMASLIVALALTVAGFVVLGRSALTLSFVPMPLFRIGIWGVSLAFAARAIGEFRYVGLFKRERSTRFAYVGLFKRERSTRFARLDTWLFTPLCVVMSAVAAVLASA
jgi:hypothetical protein